MEEILQNANEIGQDEDKKRQRFYWNTIRITLIAMAAGSFAIYAYGVYKGVSVWILTTWISIPIALFISTIFIMGIDGNLKTEVVYFLNKFAIKNGAKNYISGLKINILSIITAGTSIWAMIFITMLYISTSDTSKHTDSIAQTENNQTEQLRLVTESLILLEKSENKRIREVEKKYNKLIESEINSEGSQWAKDWKEKRAFFNKHYGKSGYKTLTKYVDRIKVLESEKTAKINEEKQATIDARNSKNLVIQNNAQDTTKNVYAQLIQTAIKENERLSSNTEYLLIGLNLLFFLTFNYSFWSLVAHRRKNGVKYVIKDKDYFEHINKLIGSIAFIVSSWLAELSLKTERRKVKKEIILMTAQAEIIDLHQTKEPSILRKARAYKNLEHANFDLKEKLDEIEGEQRQPNDKSSLPPTDRTDYVVFYKNNIPYINYLGTPRDIDWFKHSARSYSGKTQTPNNIEVKKILQRCVAEIESKRNDAQ